MSLRQIRRRLFDSCREGQHGRCAEDVLVGNAGESVFAHDLCLCKCHEELENAKRRWAKKWGVHNDGADAE